MKRSIKNRIAAALLLAASFGGHNYKAAANYYVDSKNIKNNKQSTSLPLWAKIGIPVGIGVTLGLFIGGISKLRPTRANISLNDIHENMNNFVNEQEIKRKKKNAQAREEQIRQYKQESKKILEHNYQFLTKNAGNNPTKMSCVQNLKKLADNFLDDYYNKRMIVGDNECLQLLESKYKYLKFPVNVYGNGDVFGDANIEYREFKDNYLITKEECENITDDKCFRDDLGFILKPEHEYAVKYSFSLLRDQWDILRQLFLGIGKIDDSYKYEINNDGSLSVYKKDKDKLNNSYISFDSAKISLDCNKKELKVVYNGKYLYEKAEKNVQIISIFDVSEWLKDEVK